MWIVRDWSVGVFLGLRQLLDSYLSPVHYHLITPNLLLQIRNGREWVVWRQTETLKS